MLEDYREPRAKANEYAEEKGMILQAEPLGWGYDGIVVSTNKRSAIKAFKYKELFRKELAVYLRLTERDLTSIHEFVIPRMLGYCARRWLIEMEIVEPPFIVDFASAYLDTPPDYDDELLETEERKRREEFGDNWSKVTILLANLRRHGIYLVDANPRNIAFSDPDHESE